jgi:hypothetical protein
LGHVCAHALQLKKFQAKFCRISILGTTRKVQSNMALKAINLGCGQLCRIMFSQPLHLSIMVVHPLRLIHTDVSCSQNSRFRVDNYDTLYLEGPNKLQHPFLMMGEELVLCLDKRPHNSSVGVMLDPFVGIILTFQRLLFSTR